MQITRLSAAECEDLYRSALPRDFPAAELKPFAEIQRLLESGVYEPLLLTDDAGARLAYAWQVVLPGQRTALLDYFAVRYDLRGSGVGTAALGLVRDYDAMRVHDLVLECEHPAEAPDPAPRGGASGFTCGQVRGPRRWKAGCSARGTPCWPCPAAVRSPTRRFVKSCARCTRSWCRTRIIAGRSYFTAARHILPPKKGGMKCETGSQAI